MCRIFCLIEFYYNFYNLVLQYLACCRHKLITISGIKKVLIVFYLTFMQDVVRSSSIYKRYYNYLLNNFFLIYTNTTYLCN